jgi:hypothetical protein
MRIPFLNRTPAEFGSCCHDLKDAMTKPPNSLFRISEWGVLYLTVGYVHSDNDIGWMDQALMFCPFCGKKLQSKEDVRIKSAQASNVSKQNPS